MRQPGTNVRAESAWRCVPCSLRRARLGTVETSKATWMATRVRQIRFSFPETAWLVVGKLSLIATGKNTTPATKWARLHFQIWKSLRSETTPHWRLAVGIYNAHRMNHMEGLA